MIQNTKVCLNQIFNKKFIFRLISIKRKNPRTDYYNGRQPDSPYRKFIS